MGEHRTKHCLVKLKEFTICYSQTFSQHFPLHSIASRHPHPGPFPLQSPVPTLHGHQGRSSSHTGDAPAALGRNQIALQSQLQACICTGCSGCPTPHRLLDLEMQLHFLPHAEVPWLCQNWAMGCNPKAVQCGGSSARMTEKQNNRHPRQY